MKAESNLLNLQLTMRLFLPFFLLVASINLFAQDNATIKEINELVGPSFQFHINNTINCGFFNNGKQNNKCGCYYEEEKRIIVIARSINEKSCNYKVFVFKPTKYDLKMIDSSTSFCFIKGCNVEVRNDTITLNSLIHNAGYSFIYKFDAIHQKYFLRSVKFFEVTYGKSMENFLQEEKTYDVIKQLLAFRTIHKLPKGSSFKKKVINKPLPNNFKKEMSAFIDPNEENDASLIYNNIFDTN